MWYLNKKSLMICLLFSCIQNLAAIDKVTRKFRDAYKQCGYSKLETKNMIRAIDLAVDKGFATNKQKGLTNRDIMGAVTVGIPPIFSEEEIKAFQKEVNAFFERERAICARRKTARRFIFDMLTYVHTRFRKDIEKEIEKNERLTLILVLDKKSHDGNRFDVLSSDEDDDDEMSEDFSSLDV